ncbi:MAG: HEAT repeat domain-containing protein [Planctomycetota bacterium]|jgi:hypothetical protein
MRIHVRCLAAAALSVLVTVAGTRDARAANVGQLASLAGRLASNPFDGNAMKDIERICFEAGRPGAEAERAGAAKALLSMLGPQVSVDARAFILKQVARIGKAEVVAGLSRLLEDPDARIRECARRALQNNPSPDAGKPLVKALGEAKDAVWRAALADAIGSHGLETNAGSLIELLDDDEEAVGVAAAAALGKIGGTDAAKALASAMSKGSAELRTSVADAYLSCADRFLAEGRFTEATAIYKKIHSTQGSNLYKIAGMQGIAAVQAAKAAGRKEVAAKPSTSGRSSGRASAGKSTVDPEVMAAWDKRLQGVVEASVKAGQKPGFHLTSMRARVRLVGLTSAGALKVSSRGMQLSVPMTRLVVSDKKNLAGAVAGKDTKGNAVAAFYCLAAGDKPAAGAYLRKAGRLAGEVQKAFE